MKPLKCWIKQKKTKECEDNFIKQGNLLQEELIAFCKGKNLPIHLFSAKQVNKMSYFAHDDMLSDDACFQLYRGTIEENNRPVCIKKYYCTNPFIGIQGIIREIVIATQMRMHGNSLNLLGCSLETETPVLVFELPDQGCLRDHIFRQQGSLSWKLRLKIGYEISYALTYLQTSFHRPIIFRNLSSKDVFLDKDYVAKLTGFYFSVLIPEGEDHVNDAIVGTVGYGAPEYSRSGRLTEKTDVYCFGVLLFELLIGVWNHQYGGYSLQLLRKIKDYGQNIEIEMIIDPKILEEVEEKGMRQHLKEVPEIAVICTADDENHRPSMVDIASKLKIILCST